MLLIRKCENIVCLRGFVILGGFKSKEVKLYEGFSLMSPVPSHIREEIYCKAIESFLVVKDYLSIKILL